MTAKKEKLYYPVQDVQEQLFPDISKDSIIRLIERGEIPAKRITNKYFIPAWWWNEQIEFATVPTINFTMNNITLHTIPTIELRMP